MLEFDSITYQYDAEPVVSDISFAAAAGEITCVVGPSGCGKTTLLRLAAGLLPMQGGAIRLDNELLCDARQHVPPEKRPVGLVFQEGALFPHLTAAENIGFGIPRNERKRRVPELLQLVGLDACADRLPHTLSGGQRQRVALARAMAPRPRALLFDEPYANLDQELRRTLREEARRNVRETGTVGVFVTHDADDVMALADRVIVIEGGRLMQAGTPRELYDHPASASIARMLGVALAVRADVLDGQVQTAFGPWDSAVLRTPASGPVDLILRPEWLRLEPVTAGSDASVIDDLRVAGRCDIAAVRGSDDASIQVELLRPHHFRVGDSVRVFPAVDSVLAETVSR
jgi:iron(III) transport system ATP-binding protein